MSEASDGKSDTQVPNQLTSLVPQFDPAQHDLEQYTQKVELLTEIWPQGKIDELITRLILGTSGAAFQKLQLQRSTLLTGDKSGVEKLVAILGGHWGKISLERKYEKFEKAVFRCVQRADESNDSFLARADILWSELLASQVTLEELQAYIVLRGSQLSADDKKRVILESESSKEHALDMTKVTSSVRMLGSGFFHDVTGIKKAKGKIYDAHTMYTEEYDEPETALVTEEWDEESWIEQLAADGDEDAVLICEYESAMQDTLQEDESLATTLNAYTDARRRLNDRFKNRGFWPTSGAKGKSKGTKGKGKGNFKGARKSLQQRILESNCRHCGKRGHWRAECPERLHGSSGSNSNAQAPAMMAFSQLAGDEETLPSEFMMLPEIVEEAPAVSRPQEVNVTCHHPGFSKWGNLAHGVSNNQGIYPNLNQGKDKFGVLQPSSVPRSDRVGQVQPSSCEVMRASARATGLAEDETIMFASHGTFGILDSGATKTVVGSQFVSELLQNLHPSVRQNVRRCRCEVTFRFGNQGTLDSQFAMVIPIGRLGLKIAVVPGRTPLLLSNTLLRTLKATVDVANQQMHSPFLKVPIQLNLNSRGLFLVDLNEISLNARKEIPTADTFVHETPETSKQPKTKGSPIMSESDPTVFCSKKGRTKLSNEHSFHKESLENSHDEVSNTLEHAVTKHVNQSTFDATIDEHTRHDQPAHAMNFPHPCSPHENPKPGTKKVVTSEQRESDHTAQHEPGRPPEPSMPASRDWRQPGRLQGVVTGTDGCHSHQFWQSPPGQDISPSVGSRDPLGAMVCPHLRELRQTGTSEAHSLCDDDGRTCGAGDRIRVPPTATAQSESQGQEHASSHSADRPRSRGRGGSMAPSRDGVNAHLHARECQHREHPCTAASNERSRECSGGDLESSAIPELSAERWAQGMCQAGDIDAEETCFHASNMSSLQKGMNQLIRQFTEELQHVANECQTTPGAKLNVLEVFCSSNSELTRQTGQLGHRAQRFGYDQGDLATVEGRRSLFQLLIQKQPDNVWISPTCGPWSSWNNLNASKSVESFDAIHGQRVQNLYQLALGIVLLRHQWSSRRHFHWEQPRRSLMFKSPLLRELFEKTYCALFDMCKVGQLRDPENNKLIQKGLEIRTTSWEVFSQLHGRYCNHDHEHQVLEGTTVYKGVRMNRTEFSELHWILRAVSTKVRTKFSQGFSQFFQSQTRAQRFFPLEWDPDSRREATEESLRWA